MNKWQLYLEKKIRNLVKWFLINFYLPLLPFYGYLSYDSTPKFIIIYYGTQDRSIWWTRRMGRREVLLWDRKCHGGDLLLSLSSMKSHPVQPINGWPIFSIRFNFSQSRLVFEKLKGKEGFEEESLAWLFCCLKKNYQEECEKLEGEGFISWLFCCLKKKILKRKQSPFRIKWVMIS